MRLLAGCVATTNPRVFLVCSTKYHVPFRSSASPSHLRGKNMRIVSRTIAANKTHSRRSNLGGAEKKNVG